MQRMKLLAAVLFATSLLAGCSNADLEDRVKKLEAENKKYEKEMAWLAQVYQSQQQQAAQQQQQRAEQEANEPAPDAVFAVAIADSLKAGQLEGPNAGTCVTVIEAFDFA